jgi:group I intron endonuclease
MVIYAITNKISGKKYIGQCRGLIKRRWSSHCSTKSSPARNAIKSAILKYGRDNFTFEIIDSASTNEELETIERYWIRFYNTIAPGGYNLKEGGASGKYSEEARTRMSESRKRYYDKVGRKGKTPYIPRKRRPWTQEEKELRRQWSSTIRHSSEIREKIAASKRRSVVRSDGAIFNSLEEAALSVRRSPSTICRVLKGTSGRHTCGGYRWKYAEMEALNR